MIKSIIVATSINQVIGKKGRLPWHLPADLQHFKKLTMGHHVIMGRKTFESIPNGLPGRNIIVLSKQRHHNIQDAIVVHSIEDAFQIAEKAHEQEVFIAGGATIYQEAMRWVDKVYLTAIDATITGDSYFPSLNYDEDWRIIRSIYHSLDTHHAYGFHFLTLERCQ